MVLVTDAGFSSVARSHCTGLLRDGAAVKLRADALRAMEIRAMHERTPSANGQHYAKTHSDRPRSACRPGSARLSSVPRKSASRRPLSAQRPSPLRPASAVTTVTGDGSAAVPRPVWASGGDSLLRVQYPIMGGSGGSERCRTCNSGKLKRPKLGSDDVKLKDLLAYCRLGNFREVRAIAAHFPYLLSMTDTHGLAALHHAEMSGNSDFVAQVLELYRHPRSFVIKHVRYESLAALKEDLHKGFRVRGGRTATLPKNAGGGERLSGKAFVQNNGKRTVASLAGIMPGDTMEAVLGDGLLTLRSMPPIAFDDVLDALCRSPAAGGAQFPIILEFRGSALGEILGDGWAPTHAAAGMCSGMQYRRILEQLLFEQDQARSAIDACGCTPKEWVHIEDHIRRRRPLSAGTAGRSQTTPFSGRPGVAFHGAFGVAQDRPPSASSSATSSRRAGIETQVGSAEQENELRCVRGEVAPMIPSDWEDHHMLETCEGRGPPATSRPIVETRRSRLARSAA